MGDKKISRRGFLTKLEALVVFSKPLGRSVNKLFNSLLENKKEWCGICLNVEYAKLFQKIGIPYEVLNLKGDEQYIARQVGDFAKKCGKKPFIVDFGHYLMAYAMSPEDSVICFDNHHDDGIDYNPNQKFTSGTFHLFSPAKKTFVLGTTDKQYGNAVRSFRPENIDEFFNEDIGHKIFLSYDLDVLDPKYYKVHVYAQSNLSPMDVSNLTERIIKGKNITGLNIACYDSEAKEAIPIVRTILQPIFG